MAEVQVFGERRLHQRKECSFPITISDRKRAYPGIIRNLSLGGALIEPPMEHHPRIGQVLRLTIPFRLKKANVRIRGKIDRVQADGIGIVFIKKSR